MFNMHFKSNEIIILSGPSSTGKSYFAKTHFQSSQLLSSDYFRYMISDVEFQSIPSNTREYDGDRERITTVSQKQFHGISADAFSLLSQSLSTRAKYGKLTVVDATSLYLEDIEQYQQIAAQHHVPISVVLFDIPLESALAYDRERQYPRGGRKIKHQYRALGQLLKSKREMNRIGVREIYVLKDPGDAVVFIEDNPLHIELGTGIDVLGDGHGLLASRIALLEKGGYKQGEDGLFRHPECRKLVYLNDETSRGSLPLDQVEYGQYPSIAMISLMKKHVEAGLAYAVDSNHNYKVWRWLEGRNVTMGHGDEVVASEFEAFEQEYGLEKTLQLKKELADFLKSLPSHLVVMDRGKQRAVIVHAGIQDSMIGKEDHAIRDFCRYGPTDGFTEDGKPNRLDWTKDHKNGLLIIWGHVPHPEASVVRDTINIDQGGFCGHYLTMLRYPEMELVQEKIPRSFVEPDNNPILRFYDNRFEVPLLQNYDEGFEVTTKWGKLFARRDHVKSAIEMVSTRTVPIEEMFYVPPTMSPPPNTAAADGYLEHPNEAFEYFMSKDVRRIVVEKKHMGSRAVLALFKDEDVGRKYLNRPTLGTILSRNNLRFFKRDEEQAILQQLIRDLMPYFKEMNTDLLVLDAEILPWNLKAGELIRKQYGLVSNAASYKRHKHLESLKEFQAKRGIDVTAEIAEAERKLENAQLFHQAFSYYCWNVEGIEDVQIAPFHVLAFSHKTNFDETHEWHMEQARKLSELSKIVIDTPYRVIDLQSNSDKADVVNWWLENTSQGHEGFVLKPLKFVTEIDGELVQPAIKVRGREYLRIIYGMDYLEADNLKKLKKRSTSKKMRNAIREFMLSMESIERFVKRERVEKIHECVLAAIAFESEPMDPRL